MTARVEATPPELEPFLHAEILREDNGMVLTVASAFARLDLDPWHQAALLARLSEAAAAASLAALLGRLDLAPRADAKIIASRLVPLLPRGETPARPRENGAAPPAARSSIPLWLFWAAILAAAAYMVWF